jgi:N-acetyl-anhydromuramyl-L-alanine amidase AmpD
MIIKFFKNLFRKSTPTPPPPQSKPRPRPTTKPPTPRNTTTPPPVRVAPISHAPSNNTNFSETIRLSKQTNGPYAQRITPQAIVLHHTSGNYAGSVSWTDRIFNDQGKRLYASYHCIIARDGRRTVMNNDDNRAFHAGASSFGGRNNLNTWSIGVAWERDTYTEPLSDAAIESALQYILPRMKRWNISPDMVTDHRTVSPGRKTDIAPREYEKFMKILRERWGKYK